MKDKQFPCVRYDLFCLMAVSLLFSACTPVPPVSREEYAARQKQVSDFFLQVRLRIKSGDAEWLYHHMSRDTRDWFMDMRMASDTEPLRFLRDRPFFEILGILALRVEERIHPEFKKDPVSILRRTILEVPRVRKTFIRHRMGQFKVDRNRAEVGLAKAPNVPVFFFTLENEEWKFDLIRSLPLILLGAENIARQKRQDILEQAVFILEEAGGEKVLPEDLFD
ncbi:hypothetical protein ACFL5V_02795 [Fibrobacterota bacterium]